MVEKRCGIYIRRAYTFIMPYFVFLTYFNENLSISSTLNTKLYRHLRDSLRRSTKDFVCLIHPLFNEPPPPRLLIFNRPNRAVHRPSLTSTAFLALIQIHKPQSPSPKFNYNNYPIPLHTHTHTRNYAAAQLINLAPPSKQSQREIDQYYHRATIYRHPATVALFLVVY